MLTQEQLTAMLWEIVHIAHQATSTSVKLTPRSAEGRVLVIELELLPDRDMIDDALEADNVECRVVDEEDMTNNQILNWCAT